jgi:hypothetical protein
MSLAQVNIRDVTRLTLSNVQYSIILVSAPNLGSLVPHASELYAHLPGFGHELTVRGGRG